MPPAWAVGIAAAAAAVASVAAAAASVAAAAAAAAQERAAAGPEPVAPRDLSPAHLAVAREARLVPRARVHHHAARHLGDMGLQPEWVGLQPGSMGAAA